MAKMQWLPRGPEDTVLDVVVMVLTDWFNGLICNTRGHKWNDVSHAGPESGNMAMECSRCGEFHENILY